MKVLLHEWERKKLPDFLKEFPDELLNEDWAQKIHGQTLKHLNERGGLSPLEMLVNVRKLSFKAFNEMNDEMAINILNTYLKLWKSHQDL